MAFAAKAQAQQTYTGRVAKDGGQAIQRASVVLKDKRGRVVSFSRSDAKGAFSLTLPEGRRADSLSVRCVGFAPESIALDKHKNGSTIVLKEKIEEIKEVVVKPKDMWRQGDTLTFNVGALAQKQDKYIEDVIRRIPGVRVSPTGQILYQGKEINKFYVEGLDMMGGSYAQVSRNLTADKVRNVQVYENHEPIKMKRGVTFSEQAAMNIQLKDGAKGVWTGVAEAGLGLALQDDGGWLRDGRLVGMFFGSRRQALSMYKTNNTGKNISTEVNRGGDNADGLLSNLVYPSGGPSSFNDSHLLASNWLFKTSDDANLNVQLHGFVDKSTSKSYSESHYFNEGGGQTVITEDQSLTGKTSQWGADLTYNYNGSKAYVNNKLHGYIDFDKGYGTSILNGTETSQLVKPRRRTVSNKLSVGKRWKSQMVNFRFDADYSYLPGTLLLKDGGRETLDMQALNLDAHASFSHKLWGDWRASYNVGTVSKVELMDVSYGSEDLDDRFALHKLYVYPSLSYSNKRLSVSISPRVNLLYRSIGGQSDRRAYIDPSADFSYKFTKDLTLTASYSYDYYADGSLRTLTRVPYYSSYNSLSQGLGEFTHSTTHRLGTGLSYSDMDRRLAINASFGALAGKSNLYQGTVADGLYSTAMTAIKKTSRTYHARCGASKRFSFWTTQLSVSASHMWRNFYFLRDSKPEPACNRSANIDFDLSFRPLTLFSVSIASAASFSSQDKKLSATGAGSFSNYMHSLRLFLLPGRWQVCYDMSLAHSTDKTQKSSLTGNASVMYRTKSFDIGLHLNNVFGSHEQRLRTVTEYGEFYTVSCLRPTELMAKCSFNL